MHALNRILLILPLLLVIFTACPAFSQNMRQGCPIGGFPLTSCPVTTDSVIQRIINTRLATLVPPSCNMITVDVTNGVVTLRGQMTSQADVDMAAVIASSVRGVSCVTNLLTITLGSQRDTAILAQVMKAIGKQPYDINQVSVSVSEGIVRLKGVVDSDYVSTQLSMVAAAVEGVVGVQNDLIAVGVRSQELI